VQILADIDEAALASHRARNEFFWLDLVAPSDEDVKKLGALLGLHPLAVQDTLAFGQRP